MSLEMMNGPKVINMSQDDKWLPKWQMTYWKKNEIKGVGEITYSPFNI